MSTLYLIRHGQASFLDDHYDRLSDRGVDQARRLGAYAADVGWRLDALYSGPRARQLDTARHMTAAAAGSGVALPEPHTLAAFDEYPFEVMVKQVLPRLVDSDPELAALWHGAGDRRAGLSRFIEKVTALWSRGELDAPGIEPYAAFCARVAAGLDQVMREQGRGKTVAVVTSGGPISQAVGRALALDAEHTWRIAWVVRNASITEFAYREDAFGLVAFNATPHLRPDEVTYR